MTVHVYAADIPKTSTGWHQLGHEAGFSNVMEVFTTQSDLFWMYVLGNTAARHGELHNGA